MAVNDGIGNDIRDPFPGVRPWGNRAPGSQGDSPGETFGPVVGTPVVSNLYGSSQLPQNRPTLPVTAGDSSSMSSDECAQESPISPGPAGRYTSTGAGEGSTTTKHPNSMSGA